LANIFALFSGFMPNLWAAAGVDSYEHNFTLDMRPGPYPLGCRMNSAPAVRLIDVDKVFGEKTVAVNGLNLSIAQGQYTSIIGPSGCGKTTTLRLVAGFEEPTSGRVEIAGRDCTHLEPHQRNTAMVFQHFALFPHMTVAKNVAFGLEMRRVPAPERLKRVVDILKALDIEELADRAVTQLSGGQQQRVGLARALVVHPDILLLDEPLGSLDANLRERMMRMLKKLNNDLGVAFMHVTHTQAEAFAVSDRVVIMNHGRIEQMGTPEEVSRHPKNLFVAQFVGKNNILAGEIVGEVDGFATVNTRFGSLRAQATKALPRDRRDCYVVCPARRIGVLQDGEAPENQLEGRLVFTMLETANLELNVDIGDNTVIRVDRFDDKTGLATLQPGTPLRLGWKAEDTLLVFD
jgi:ABC-type Fe3+/spermidine/putrescine transport system ATPase subunit